MSRDRVRAANFLEYRVMRLNMELTAARNNARDTLFLITDIYEPELWVLPHMLEEHYVFHRHREVYERLMQDARNYMHEANRLEEQIFFYQDRIYALRGPYSPASPEDVRFVEESIPVIFDSLREWETIINQTVEDFLYLELYRDAVRQITPALFHNSYIVRQEQMILIVVLAGFVGLLVGFIVALYKAAFNREVAAK